MKVFKRISTSISAQINSLVDQIENHEAVADVALNDIRSALMNARFQIKRVQNEQRAFEQRLNELKTEETRWTERALQARDQDHERAIECARRLKKSREDCETIARQLKDHQALEIKLNDDVRRIETRFTELKNKRNVLAARESRAEALSAVAEHEGKIDASGVFDRWERQIMRSEVAGEGSFEDDRITDSFAAKFESEEERRDLETLLTELGKKE